MIDVEKLLAPISADGPAGPDLRGAADDRTFQTIEGQRREIDGSIDDAGGKAANWPAVRRSCEQALSTLSKDLRLAGWLTEALGRTEGYAGLIEGLKLIRALLDRYWDHVHPQPDLDGEQVLLDRRAAALNWLSSPKGMLPSVRAIGVVGNTERRDEWLSWESYLESQRVDAASTTNRERFDEMVAAGAVTSERWLGALTATPPTRLRGECETLRACEAELRDLEGFCDERFGDAAPSLLELRTLVADVREYFEGKLPGAAPGASDATAEGPRPAAARAGAPAVSGHIATRSDALVRLSEVAQFFRQTEPHSPVSRLVERAVRWGNMSFEDLLRDVVRSEDALNQIWETLGVKPPEARSS
jgi:type VI secretion system protein ImpA